MQKLGGTKENTMVFEDARYCTKTLVENNFRFMIVRDDSQCDDLEELQSLGRPFVNDYADLMK